MNCNDFILSVGDQAQWIRFVSLTVKSKFYRRLQCESKMVVHVTSDLDSIRLRCLLLLHKDTFRCMCTDKRRLQ